jgi:hypothetical protein
MDFLRQIFLNPGMLLGTALVAVPIIIYLINRQRFERRKWAAMELLLRALERNRRRLQLQNLLLLLIRTALILFIVLAAARPVSRLSILSLTPHQSQSWILVLDGSYSMGYQEESRSSFDLARQTVREMADSMFKPGDQVALLLADARPRVLLPPTPVGEQGRRQLEQALEDLSPSARGLDLGAAFAVLDELCGKLADAAGAALPKRIVVFSDLQRRDWLDENGPRHAGVPAFIDKIRKEGGEFVFARLGQRAARPNLAITDLSVVPALVGEDTWIEIRATIENLGDEEFTGVDFTVRVDPETGAASQEPQMGEVLRVAARGTEIRRLAHRFTTPGYHTVVAELRSDGLLIDNRRFLTLRVEDSVKVLLVDGNPSSDPVERETFHLQVALEPEDDSMGAVQGRFTPFQAVYVTPDRLGEVAWKEYPVVILAGVPEVAPAHAAALKGYVKDGGALIAFLGPRVRPDFYNEHFRGEDGGILPFPLGEVRGDTRYPVSFQVADPSHPLAAYFEARREFTHLQRPLISFYKYFEVVEPKEGAPGVRVPFRFSDTRRSPAVFDCAHGQGRVLWITSSAGDDTWNELPSWPDYVVFLYEAISYLVEAGLSASNLRVGETFRRTYPGAQFASEVLLQEPELRRADLDRVRTVRKAMRQLEGRNEFEIVHEDAGFPGLYILELKRPSAPGTDTVEAFAVNVDTAESDLTTMTRQDFADHYPNLGFQEFRATERIEEMKERERQLGGREHWKWLIYAVLLLLIAETILAWLFGRRGKA